MGGIECVAGCANNSARLSNLCEGWDDRGSSADAAGRPTFIHASPSDGHLLDEAAPRLEANVVLDAARGDQRVEDVA